MDIVAFFEEKKRLTEDCHICCGNCKLSIGNNGTNMSCEELIEKCTKEAVEILEKWSRENPVKTMMDDFFEKFPNAPRKGNGYPICCPNECGYVKESKCTTFESCVVCWSRPLEVTK